MVEIESYFLQLSISTIDTNYIQYNISNPNPRSSAKWIEN